MDDRTRLHVLERDMTEMGLIAQELLDTVRLLVVRIEAQEGAQPMDAARSGIVHIENRLHDLLTHYLSEHEQRKVDFPHPEFDRREK